MPWPVEGRCCRRAARWGWIVVFWEAGQGRTCPSDKKTNENYITVSVTVIYRFVQIDIYIYIEREHGFTGLKIDLPGVVSAKCVCHKGPLASYSKQIFDTYALAALGGRTHMVSETCLAMFWGALMEPNVTFQICLADGKPCLMWRVFFFQSGKVQAWQHLECPVRTPFEGQFDRRGSFRHYKMPMSFPYQMSSHNTHLIGPQWRAIIKHQFWRTMFYIRSVPQAIDQISGDQYIL